MARITYVVSKPPAVPGPQGPPGDTGPTGPEGPPGDPGPDTELRARVDPGTTGSERQQVRKVNGTIKWSTLPEFDVRDYGATGNGSTDDTANVLVALAACKAAGGGTLRFTGPNTTYLLNTAVTLTPSGKQYILPIDFDNCRIKIDAGVIVKTTLGTANVPSLINVSGSYKGALAATGSRNNWGDYWFGKPDATGHPVYAVTAAVAKGAISITTATAANAGNFAAGDLIYIRTGQTVSSSTSEPDAEINEVISADAGTGIILLKYPTSKAYAQEYYVSGTSGVSTTSVTANAAAYGVQKVTGSVVRNFTLEGPGKIVSAPSTNRNEVLGGHQVWGLTVRDLEVDIINGHMQNMGLFRWAKASKCRVHIKSTTAGRVYFTGSTGVNDFTIEDCDLSSSDTVSMVHLAEGNANVKLLRTSIYQRTVTDSANRPITSGSRGYDITIDHCNITRLSGGLITFSGTQPVDGLTLTNNRLVGGSTSIGVKNLYEANNIGPDTLSMFDTYGAVASGIRTNARWVYFDSAASLLMQPIPAFAVVTSVTIQVFTLFNGTTPTLTVGQQSPANATKFAGSTALGVATTLTGTAGYMSGVATRVPEILLSAGGSTAGRALVTICWAMAPQGNGI